MNGDGGRFQGRISERKRVLKKLFLNDPIQLAAGLASNSHERTCQGRLGRQLFEAAR